MAFEVRRITNGPKHHFFGFHDLSMTNVKGDLALALEVDDISHPPLPGENCRSGVIHLDASDNRTSKLENNFEAIHSTRAWNYPQGARQQWVGDTDMFVCNDREDNGRLVAHVGDARRGRVVETLSFPVYCIESKTNQAFYFNFDRLHAVGGYGYTPLTNVGNKRIDDLPDNDGIFIGNLKTGESRLFVSIRAVAACGEPYPVKTGYPHYVTHAMLNPSGTRLAFLHQYRVPDGGDIARILTIGIDGRDLRCLAKGFLSHYTWVDDETIFTWGANQSTLCRLREAPWLRIPGVLQGALLAKSVIRQVRGLKSSRHAGGRRIGCAAVGQGKSMLFLKDREVPGVLPTGLGIVTEDGHPMGRPGDYGVVVNDTYPDSRGDRTLMFYDTRTQVRTDVGQFRMIADKPDAEGFDWRASQAGIDPRVLKKFDRDDYLFYRSGFHCDLHPRWSFDGHVAYFDSIHEGGRQVYAVDYPRR